MGNNIVIINKYTGEIVPFIVDKRTGEVKINSVNPDNNDESCIVTTWENLINLNNKIRRDKIGKIKK